MAGTLAGGAMRQVATIVVAALVLAAPQAAAKGGPPTQLLGFVSNGRQVSVVKLDALTLAPISRAAATGTQDAYVVARGGWIAVSTGSASLRFLDAKTMKWAFRITYPGRPAAAVWNYANRLVTLNESSTAEVVVVDPEHRRLRSFKPLGGSVAAYAVAGDRIVALVAPIDGIGATKLAVIDDLARVRTTPLPLIRAGTEVVGGGNGDVAKFQYPALAVDQKRAVVIAPDGTTVSVGLDTLSVTAHSLGQSVMSVRKQANGSSRNAHWVDANVIAVTGWDASFDGTTQRSTPAGLTLIDTRNWNSRKVDPDVIGIAPNGYGPGCIVCSGVLLTYGSNGLAGYEADGTLRFRLFAGKNVDVDCVAMSYAYVSERSATHFTIIDTSTGKVVKTVDTARPTFLAPYYGY